MQSSRSVSANGIEIFLIEQGQGPLVLLCHGWPELSYSWRHQIPAIAAAGYHVVAPDMRGFGRTSAPADIAAYSIFDLVGDMVAALGETIGGAPVAWHAALFLPSSPSPALAFSCRYEAGAARSTVCAACSDAAKSALSRPRHPPLFCP